MKTPPVVPTLLAFLLSCGCAGDQQPAELVVPDFSPVSRVDSARAVAVMLTAYSTTLLADGV